ncbi:MAG TPA: exodeoxyribonuclease VII small subunit [Roseiflexaceae bacterium]|nr:exodeoxyribonuclease VII small subunit [Roseiflexaceae bacterium]
MADQTNTMTYESLFARMQEIVAALEAGELPLERALALYEEGVAVAAACQRLLDNAVLRVQELQGSGAARPGPRED